MSRTRLVQTAMMLLGLVATVVVPSLAAAATYYVATTGSNNAPGTKTQPWRSIAFAAGKAVAGDTVVVTAGIYREGVAVKRSGSAARPITLRGLSGAVLESPDPNKSWSAFDVAARVAYVRLQGFEARGGFAETVYLRPGAHDIELAGLNLHDNRTGIWVAGASRIIIRDSVLRNNYRTGVRIFAGARDVQIINTRSEGNDDGAGCDGDSDGFNADSDCSNILFDSVIAAGNSEDGFDLQASNVTLLRVTSQRNQCSGMKLNGNAYVENALVEGNRTGINSTGPAGAQATIVFSSLLNNDLGLRALGADFTLALTDSVVSGPGKALDYATDITLIEARNVFARPELRERLIVQEAAAGQVLFSGNDINAGKWARASGQGAGSVARDPGLDSRTYVPKSGSPAIDKAGVNGAVTRDHDGNPRPAGAAPDCGAFERQTATAQLQLRRALVRSDESGSGRARFSADLRLPGGAGFDPRTDALSVVLSGARGPLGSLELAAGALRASDGGVYRAAVRDRDGAVLHLALTERAGGYAVSLRGHNVETWRAPDGEVTLDVTAGSQRACATTALRGASGQFALP
ncbi:MAG: right-handed parallel beta-helix repeat-containing protein [Deltaproteobacteria bacterium]|nr:right-handed parallel beta-helix repeat-containing protein [Deltaproteobacteria bacterium]